LETFTVKAKSFTELFRKLWDEGNHSEKILDNLNNAEDDEKAQTISD
jgi:hypothetical protein